MVSALNINSISFNGVSKEQNILNKDSKNQNDNKFIKEYDKNKLTPLDAQAMYTAQMIKSKSNISFSGKKEDKKAFEAKKELADELTFKMRVYQDYCSEVDNAKGFKHNNIEFNDKAYDKLDNLLTKDKSLNLENKCFAENVLYPEEIGNIFDYKPLSKEYPNIRIKKPTENEPYYKYVIVGNEKEYFKPNNKINDINDMFIQLLYAIKEKNPNAKTYNDLLKNAIGKDNYVSFKFVPEDEIEKSMTCVEKNIENFDKNNYATFNIDKSSKNQDEINQYLPLNMYDSFEEFDSAYENMQKIDKEIMEDFDRKIKGKNSVAEEKLENDIESIANKYKNKYDNKVEKFINSIENTRKKEFDKDLNDAIEDNKKFDNEIDFAFDKIKKK